MAVFSGFVRESRFGEVAGCPLAKPGVAADDGSCAGCDYNVLNPTQPRVGCVLNTRFDDYRRAMAHLAKISAADHGTVEAILKAERDSGNEVGLPRPQLEDLARIAAAWADLVGNDPGEQVVVTAMLRFSEAALTTAEPVRILA